MKKASLLTFLVFICATVFAQNYSLIKLNLGLNKLDDAKKELDKVMNDPKAKDKAETEFWKFAVYGRLYVDPTLRQQYPDAGKMAYEALNNYAAKEADLKKIKTDEDYKDFGGQALFNLYSQSFNDGRDMFQAKKWDESFNSFQLCEGISKFIGKNGLSSNKYTIDTTVVLYTAFAAQNAAKPAEAASRYKELADWKIGDKDMEDNYKFLLDYYTKANDQQNFQKYLAVAKELYPNDMPVWNQMDMTFMSMNTSLADMVTKYKQDDAAGKMTEDDYVTYAENFSQPDKKQLSELDSTKQIELKMAAADAYSKAFKLNNSNGLYAYNAGVLYYNLFNALEDRYYNLRGESAELKTQRDAVVKQEQEAASTAIEWIEKGYNILKVKEGRQKNESLSLNRSVDFLANLYLWKRDRARGINPKDYDAFDAKYKQFDAEHDKYKE